MVKMGVSKDSLEGKPPLPVGIYDFRLDGFKPKKSKDGNSINLNPILKVINNPNGQNDKDIYTSLNTGAGWIMKDLVHSLGLQMEIDGATANLPGDWVPDLNDSDNVEKMTYQGPMLGATGRLELTMKQYNGKDQNNIKQFFCKVPNCAEKHSTELK